MAVLDLFAPLERVVARYRRDVHHLPAGAASDALTALEGHLKGPLPPGLRKFLARHNGARLFRGALRVRAVSEVAIASELAPRVVLFADVQEVRWAFAPLGGGHVFGRWDGERLEPVHGHFAGWLAAQINLLDTRVVDPDDQEALRFEADPDDLHQLVRAGERALRAGRPEEAEALLHRATRQGPEHVVAWQRLGDALALTDRAAARLAWLQALRHARLPLPWPGAPSLDPDVLRPLAAAFPEPEDWERELRRFLDEQVADVTSPQEAALVHAAAEALARSLVTRGQRRDAREVLSTLLARARSHAHPAIPWDALLELARLEIDLGHHDEAEALLRRLRREGPPELQGVGHLLLGRVAVLRQEPWAEEILEEALAAGLDDHGRVEAAALRVERAIRLDRLEEAGTWLERVRPAARRASSLNLQALACLVEGDFARVQRDLPAARKAYDQGLKLLGERGDVQLRTRLVLRLGDLALAADRHQQAHQHFAEAARGFAQHQLPVREAWALLRLARLVRDPAPLLAAALERFTEADLAAGVAAVDALRGDPGASLTWHLERATNQARARHDAQRPGRDRADADRPERRLGAHRLAIAACSDGVVTALARELAACARAIGAGRGRAADRPVMRYIAAVDLLSAHRSYSAAEVLLEQLLRAPIEGPARRALQGAVARSPNAALVDGLLACVEQPGPHPAQAVAAAAEVLGLRRERAAVRALVGLAAEGANPIFRKAAVAALGRIGDRSVVDGVLPALDDPTLAETAALALLMLGDRRGVDFHGRALAEDRRDLSGSPGEIVGRYGSPEHLLLLVRVVDGGDERALGALQGLGLLGDPRAVPTLLKALQSRDRKMVEVAGDALQILTGHAEDLDDHGGRGRWNAWWEAHADRMRQGVRHRDGRPFDAGLLIERMDHHDPWVRRTSYDELVITTGCALPFDSDGPWRVQRAHLRAWKSWWQQHRDRLPSGHWYLDGQRVA